MHLLSTISTSAFRVFYQQKSRKQGHSHPMTGYEDTLSMTSYEDRKEFGTSYGKND